MTEGGTAGTVATLPAQVAAPGAPAFLAPGSAPLTYAGLASMVDEVGRLLREKGVRRGDRVAILAPNGPGMAVAFLGVAGVATAAPLNPTYRAEELTFYLTDLGARVLLVDRHLETEARGVAARLGIPVVEMAPRPEGPAGMLHLSGETGLLPAADVPARPEDVALVLHTSGTTSRPKQVPLAHHNLLASAEAIRRTLALTESDRCLNVMPLFHIHGLMAAVLASLSAGASVVCTPGFYAPQFFDWVDAFAPTWYTAVPTMHQAILARAPSHAGVIARRPLRFIRSSSASLPPRVLRDLEETFGAPVVEAYGMTEAAHQMASNPLPPGVRKPGSVGPAAGPEVRIMDAEGRFLDVGERGEVVIRGPGVTAGYVENPEANRAAFTDGWFRTGDEGYLDADGYLFLTGRLKEQINRGGEKIAPREIDEVLLDHPAVAQAVAFAAPDDRLGEEVAAAVVLAPGASVTEKALRAYVASRLASFKVPRRVLFVEAIPKGPTGKLQRIGLAARLGVTGTPPPDPSAGPPPYVAPRTTVEQALVPLWAEVLRVDLPGVETPFLALGGDSMLAARLVARVRSRFRVDLSLLDVFDAPTIADQALVIEERILDQIEAGEA